MDSNQRFPLASSAGKTGAVRPVSMRRFPRFGLALLLCLAVAGCSKFKILYSFTSEAIESAAESHLDLADDDEAAFVDRRVDDVVLWHRAVMLPKYATFLNAQAGVLDRGEVNEATIADAMQELRRLLEDTVEGGSPYIAAVLVRHTAPDKLDYLRDRMAERLAERLEEFDRPREARLEERTARIVKNFERLTGDLHARQRLLIRRYAEATADEVEAWLRNRAERQRAFTNFLGTRPDEDAIAAFTTRMLLRPHEIVGPEHEAFSATRWTKLRTLMFDVLVSLSDEQRQYMSDTLRSYAEDMVDMSS